MLLEISSEYVALHYTVRWPFLLPTPSHLLHRVSAGLALLKRLF